MSSFRTRCKYIHVSSSPASLLATVLKELPPPCPESPCQPKAWSSTAPRCSSDKQAATSRSASKVRAREGGIERLRGATETSKPGRGAFSGSVCGREAAFEATGKYSRRLPGKDTGGGLRPQAENRTKIAPPLRNSGHNPSAGPCDEPTGKQGTFSAGAPVPAPARRGRTRMNRSTAGPPAAARRQRRGGRPRSSAAVRSCRRRSATDRESP